MIDWIKPKCVVNEISVFNSITLIHWGVQVDKKASVVDCYTSKQDDFIYNEFVTCSLSSNDWINAFEK